MISIIIPAYNEEQMLPKAAKVISEIMEQNNITYEIVFVNDGSRDTTWKKICMASKDNINIKGVNFSRNFGKESAIFAGLKNCSGDCAVIIDCDLQHPPAKIVEMYHLWESGYELVEAVKTDRGKESMIHGAFAKLFYGFMSSATGIDMQNASDFKLLDRKAINVLLEMPERNVFFRALSSWIGFKSTIVEFEVQDREAGVSKWSMISLIRYAIKNITSFSAMPLQLITGFGFACCFCCVVLAIQSLYVYFSGQALEGFTTVILILLSVGGILMIALGIIGYYLAKIYDEIKGRPRYIISDLLNIETEKVI